MTDIIFDTARTERINQVRKERREMDNVKETKERPIIFNSEMIKAILEGRKTQARRIVKNKEAELLDFFTGHADETQGNSEDLMSRWESNGLRICSMEYPEEGSEIILCLYGKVGDRLWVRETFAKHKNELFYLADICDRWIKNYTQVDGIYFQGWKPPIHMPRKYSRITLEITDIRVERLQEISEEDARAEGVNSAKLNKEYDCLCISQGRGHICTFIDLWNSIHKKEHRWEDNPFVRVMGFKRIERQDVR